MWRFKSKFLVFDDFHLFGNDADQAWNDLSPSTWIRSSVSIVSWSWFDWRSIEASVVIRWLFVCGGETVPVEHWPPSRAWHRTLEASKPSIVTNASRAGQGQNWESHQTQPHAFVARPKKVKALALEPWYLLLIAVQLRACLTSQLYRSGCTRGDTGVHFFWSSSAVEAKELVSLTDQQSYLRLSLRPQYGLCARVILAMSTCSGAPSTQDQPGLLNSGMVRSQSTIWRKC